MAAPLFILSFRHRDELTRLAEGAGWQPIAARRADNAEARFVASGAAVAVVDARGALDGRARRRCGPSPMRSRPMPPPCSSCSRATMPARWTRFHQLGATHFLVSPFTEPQLLHAFQFALRHAERVGGGGSRRGRRGPEKAAGRAVLALAARLAHRRAEPGAGAQGRTRRGRRPADQPDGAVPQARPGRPPRRPRRDRAGAWRPARRPPSPMPISRTGRPHRPPCPGPGPKAGSSAVPRPFPAVEARAEPSRDPLTGLRRRPRRAGLAGRAARTGKSRRARSSCCCSSVSRYDAINAAFGRSVGDAVLQAAARRIERHADPDGRRILVARMAGAEFAVHAGAAGRRSTTAASSPASWSRRSAARSCPATMSSRSAAAAGVAVSQPGDDAAGPAAPGQRRAGRGQGRRERAGPGARGGGRERNRARRTARGRPPARARPGRDRDPLPAAGRR